MKFSLKYFILKSNSLILYREAVKLCYTIPDKNTKFDMLLFLRNEYESTRSITDEKKIEYLLGNARKKINLMKESLDITR